MKEGIEINNSIILITGVAGFIGSFLALRLLEKYKETTILGIDDLNDYYDPNLKRYRLLEIERAARTHKSCWRFFEVDIADMERLKEIFKEYSPSIIVNLAAQAGVRYSIEHPECYIHSNIDGFYNVIECCKTHKTVKHLVYASSSSVYGGRLEIPFRETDIVDTPVSLYAATKKCNELLAYSYAKLYNIPSTGLRFFTVYGPAGRPDMAYYNFTNKLVKNKTIDIFNYGNCERDFTYIDDIIEGIIKILPSPPKVKDGNDGLPIAPYNIYNIGNSHPENLLDFVHILTEELIYAGVLNKNFDIDSHINLMPMQPGDVPITYSDTSKLEKDFGFSPKTDLRTGLRSFAKWYKEFYG